MRLPTVRVELNVIVTEAPAALPLLALADWTRVIVPNSRWLGSVGVGEMIKLTLL